MATKPSVVCVTDCSKPLGEQVSYRAATRRELAQRRRDHAEAIETRMASAFLELRATRDQLLRYTDHLEADPRWARWRQKLRDLPSVTADPEKPRWPKPPVVVSSLADYRHLWPRLDWTPLTKGTR